MFIWYDYITCSIFKYLSPIVFKEREALVLTRNGLLRGFLIFVYLEMKQGFHLGISFLDQTRADYNILTLWLLHWLSSRSSYSIYWDPQIHFSCSAWIHSCQFWVWIKFWKQGWVVSLSVIKQISATITWSIFLTYWEIKWFLQISINYVKMWYRSWNVSCLLMDSIF